MALGGKLDAAGRKKAKGTAVHGAVDKAIKSAGGIFDFLKPPSGSRSSGPPLRGATKRNQAKYKKDQAAAMPGVRGAKATEAYWRARGQGKTHQQALGVGRAVTQGKNGNPRRSKNVQGPLAPGQTQKDLNRSTKAAAKANRKKARAAAKPKTKPVSGTRSKPSAERQRTKSVGRAAAKVAARNPNLSRSEARAKARSIVKKRG